MLNRVIEEGLPEKERVEQIPQGGQRKTWGSGGWEGVLGSGYSNCEGPEEGVRYQWAGAQQVKGRQDPRWKGRTWVRNLFLGPISRAA